MMNNFDKIKDVLSEGSGAGDAWKNMPEKTHQEVKDKIQRIKELIRFCKKYDNTKHEVPELNKEWQRLDDIDDEFRAGKRK